MRVNIVFIIIISSKLIWWIRTIRSLTIHGTIPISFIIGLTKVMVGRWALSPTIRTMTLDMSWRDLPLTESWGGPDHNIDYVPKDRVGACP